MSSTPRAFEASFAATHPGSDRLAPSLFPKRLYDTRARGGGRRPPASRPGPPPPWSVRSSRRPGHRPPVGGRQGHHPRASVAWGEPLTNSPPSRALAAAYRTEGGTGAPSIAAKSPSGVSSAPGRPPPPFFGAGRPDHHGAGAPRLLPERPDVFSQARQLFPRPPGSTSRARGAWFSATRSGANAPGRGTIWASAGRSALRAAQEVGLQDSGLFGGRGQVVPGDVPPAEDQALWRNHGEQAAERGLEPPPGSAPAGVVAARAKDPQRSGRRSPFRSRHVIPSRWAKSPAVRAAPPSPPQPTSITPRRAGAGPVTNS